MKLTAEERRRIKKTRQRGISRSHARAAEDAGPSPRRRVASTALTLAAIFALALSFVAASHTPTVSFGAHLLGVTSLVDWLMPQRR